MLTHSIGGGGEIKKHSNKSAVTRQIKTQLAVCVSASVCECVRVFVGVCVSV